MLKRLETFTDRVIDALNQHRQGDLPFWGSHAQEMGQMIDRNKHHVLMAPHPSPLSAHRGLLGCKSIFRKQIRYSNNRDKCQLIGNQLF